MKKTLCFLLTWMPLVAFAQVNESVADTLADVTVLSDKLYTIGYPDTRLQAIKINIPVQSIASYTKVSVTSQSSTNTFDLAPVINRAPGVSFQAGTQNTTKLSIRGIGARSQFNTSKVRLFVEGIPVTGGDGQTSFGYNDLALFGQIDIEKAPSVNNGANLGGAVYFGAPKMKRNEVVLKTAHTVGSYGFYRQVNQVKVGFSDHNSIRVVHTRTLGDGWRENSAFGRNTFGFVTKFGHDEDDFGSIEWNAFGMYTEGLSYIPSSVNERTFEDEPTAAGGGWGAPDVRGNEDYRQGALGVGMKYKLPVDALHLQVSSVIYTSFTESEEIRPTFLNNLGERSQAIGGRIGLDVDGVPGLPLALRLGAEYYRERYEYREFLNVERQRGRMQANLDQIRDFYNAYLSLSTVERIRGFSGTLGINVNGTQYESSDLLADSLIVSSRTDFAPVISPSLQLDYRRTNWVLSVSAQHGFSQPTVEEALGADSRFNADLNQQRGWTFEAGFNHAINPKGFLEKGVYYYNVSVYAMLIEEMIVTRFDENERPFGVNAGSAINQGIELTFGCEVEPRDTDVRLNPYLTYTYNRHRFDEFVDGDEDHSGNELPGVPDHQLNAGADYRFGFGLYGNVNGLYVGAIPLDDANTATSDAYFLLNSKIGLERALFDNWRLDLHAGLNNMTDTRYASMVLVNAFGEEPRYFYPGMPVNWYGGLSVSYSFD